MTAVAMELRQARPRTVAPRVRLDHDDSGWILSGPNPGRRFPDLKTALDCARRSPGRTVATVEIWHGGQYICCVPLDSSPHRWASMPSTDLHWAAAHPRFATAERYANGAGKAVFAAAGPLFWLALVLAVLAASLGWRLRFF